MKMEGKKETTQGPHLTFIHLKWLFTPAAGRGV
jgi:hypothetical protein